MGILAIISKTSCTDLHWSKSARCRSNRFWRLLIKHHLVHAAWRPLIELTRLRHVRFRKELAASETLSGHGVNIVTAGV